MSSSLRSLLLGCVSLVMTSAAAVTASAEAPRPSPPTSAGLLAAAEGRLPAFFGCLRDHGVAMLGAHRGGARAELPENAIATMQWTSSRVPVFVEADVQESRDGVLFMNHDDVLDRNTTGRGPVAEHDWAEIAVLQQRDPTAQPTAYAPPRLSEVLAWSKGRALVLLDVKPNSNVEKVIGEVEAAGASGRVMYLAYTVDQARRTLARSPEAMVAVPMLNRAYFEQMRDAGLVGPHILGMVNIFNADPALVADIAATGSFVMSGSYAGADTPDAIYESLADAPAYQAMLTRGVHSIASNRPVQAGAALLASPAYVRGLQTCGVNN